MNNTHETNYNEKLLGGYHSNDNPSHPVPVPDPRDHEHLPYPPRRHGPPSMCQRVTSKIFKVTISVMVTLLMLLVFLHVGYDTYSGCLENMGGDAAGMMRGGGKPWFHHPPHNPPGHPPHHPPEHPPHHPPEHPPHHPPVHPPENSDCRKTGCDNNSACVKLGSHVACFTAPCPPERFLCLPLATPDDSTDTPSSSPSADGPGMNNKLAEAFFACLKEHNGSAVWNHPVESCNTCRCLPGGGVSCTKKLCSNNAGSQEAANSK